MTSHLLPHPNGSFTGENKVECVFIVIIQLIAQKSNGQIKVSGCCLFLLGRGGSR